MAKEKVVLAYSGGLDTTAIIPWLKETYGYDVICCCVDVGQESELEGLDERAKYSGAEKLYIEDVVDELWYVDAADEIRIKRLMENRGYTREKCLSIMSRQLSREEYVRHCKVVLDNSATLDEVRAQVDHALIETKQEGETDASNL